MSILTTQNLSKNFGFIQAVNQINLDINAGETWGILGPNGSGKTTTLALILNLLNPTNGSYKWFNGETINPNLRIGTLLETPNFYPYLNALDNLKITAHIKGSPEENLDEIIDLVGLGSRKHSSFESYSLGMKQRLAIGAALVGNPDVLIFDEPTNGLDPEGIIDIRELLIKIRGTGKTIIMASHILEEVDRTCTHVAILQKGKLLKAGLIAENTDQQPYFILNSTNNAELIKLLNDQLELTCKILANGEIQVVQNNEVSAERINRFSYEHGIILNKIILEKPSLEDDFLQTIRATR